MSHSAIGPSGAHRWLHCTASVNAERLIRSARTRNGLPNDTSSPHADEGTRAHALAEALLLDLDIPVEGDKWSTWDDQIMLEHCLAYRDYCLARQGDIVLIEEEVTMPRIHKDCYGTADYVSFNTHSKHLDIVDLKYGAGIVVDAEKNPQAMLYAEGVRQMLIDSYDLEPQSYAIHIYQPRTYPANIVSYEYDAKEHEAFVTYAHDRAARTETNRLDFNPSDKACQWCIANPCQARSDQMFKILSEDFEDLDDEKSMQIDIDDIELDSETLGLWLQRIERLTKFFESVKSSARERAMTSSVDGYKLVQGRPSYQPNDEAIRFVMGDEAFKPSAIKSRTELTKMLGKKRFDAQLADLYTTVEGGLTLVKESDKRESFTDSIGKSFDDSEK